MLRGQAHARRGEGPPPDRRRGRSAGASTRARRRLGRAPVESLVVVVCTVVLIGLLLPALEMVWEAARRLRCVDRLRQVGLAGHRFHDAFGALPPGHWYVPSARDHAQGRRQAGGAYGSVFFHLLPFAGYEDLYLSASGTAPGWAGRHYLGWLLDDRPAELFVCPSDPSNAATCLGRAQGSYAANAL